MLAAGCDGIEQLDYVGQVPVLTWQQAQVLGDELQARLVRIARTVCDFVVEQSGHGYTPNAMARLVACPSHAWKKLRRLPARADACARQAFLDGVLAP